MPRLWLFEETIDTDVLAPGFYMKSPLAELAEHCLRQSGQNLFLRFKKEMLF